MLNVLASIKNKSMKSRLLLQVHDELIFEIAPNEEVEMEQIVREAMGSAFALNVPLEVNIGFGKSWDLAAH